MRNKYYIFLLLFLGFCSPKMHAQIIHVVNLDSLLAKSYLNFIESRVPVWLRNYKYNRFHLLEPYNPLGFNTKMINQNKIKSVSPASFLFPGSSFHTLKYKKGNLYIGNPQIFMLGGDTLGIWISESLCDGKNSIAFCDDFISLFKIISTSAECNEIKIPQDSIQKKTLNAKKNNHFFNMDNIYVKSIKNAVEKINNKNISVYEKFFPMFLFSSKQLKSIRHINSLNYKHTDGEIIIGWPTIKISYGCVEVSLKYYSSDVKKSHLMEISKVNYKYNVEQNIWEMQSQ